MNADAASSLLTNREVPMGPNRVSFDELNMLYEAKLQNNIK